MGSAPQSRWPKAMRKAAAASEERSFARPFLGLQGFQGLRSMPLMPLFGLIRVWQEEWDSPGDIARRHRNGYLHSHPPRTERTSRIECATSNAGFFTRGVGSTQTLAPASPHLQTRNRQGYQRLLLKNVLVCFSFSGSHLLTLRTVRICS